MSMRVPRSGRRARSDAVARSPRGERRGIQIGPKIRVGGTLGHIGQQIKGVLPSPGQIIGGAALPGAGLVAGGALDGSTSPTQKDIGNGVAVAGGVIGGAGLLGAGPVATSGGSAAGTAGGASPASGIAGAIAKIPGGSEVLALLSAGKIGIGDALSWLKDHGGDVLEAANVANAAYRGMQADKYANEALSTAKASYDAKAPLRTAGITGMQYAANHGNPFAAGYNQAPTLPTATAPTSGASAAGSNPWAQSLATAIDKVTTVPSQNGFTLPIAKAIDTVLQRPDPTTGAPSAPVPPSGSLPIAPAPTRPVGTPRLVPGQRATL